MAQQKTQFVDPVTLQKHDVLSLKGAIHLLLLVAAYPTSLFARVLDTYVRPYLLHKVMTGASRVATFQRWCGLIPRQTKQQDNNKTQTIKPTPDQSDSETLLAQPTNMWFHILFVFGTTMGEELFYILFLPFFLWTSGHWRKLMLLWIFVYYVGQALKDLLKLPRPPSPPVLKFSYQVNKYENEYGLPSTHTMGSASLSFYLVAITYQDWGFDYALPIGLTLATLWTAMVSLSRLYMGAHFVEDIIAGLILSGVLTSAFLSFDDQLEEWLAQSSNVPIVLPIVAFVLLILYPRTKVWSGSFGDTTIIVGVSYGSLFGGWLTETQNEQMQQQIMEMDDVNGSGAGLEALPPSLLLVVRCLVGYLILSAVRMGVKHIMLWLMRSLVLSKADLERLLAEVDEEEEREVDNAKQRETRQREEEERRKSAEEKREQEEMKEKEKREQETIAFDGGVASRRSSLSSSSKTTNRSKKQIPKTAYQRYDIDIPTKFVTYSCIGFATAIIPTALGMSRV
ncbi:Sphingosine-1-phosphate phosphatase 1 [Balamuthia mandrillaris]